MGNLVNGKLKRQNIKIEMEGTFQQTQSVMNDIEKYQPLLLIQDYKSDISESIVYVLNKNGSNPQFISAPPKLTTLMTLQMITPLSDEELTEIRRVEEEKLKAQQATQQPNTPAASPNNKGKK